MSARIPNKGKWYQPNRGEIFGNLYRTQNIDLKTNPGKMRASPRLVANTVDNDGGVSNMGVPQAFAYLLNVYYAMCGVGTAVGIGNPGTGTVMRSTSDSPSAAFQNFSGAPTDVHGLFSDMVMWAQGNDGSADIVPSLIVGTYSSGVNEIKHYTGTTWNNTWFTSTLAGVFTSNGGPKNFFEGFNGNLYVTDEDKILYIPSQPEFSGGYLPAVQPNTSGTKGANTQQGTIDFLRKYNPLWGRSTSDRLWISLMTFGGGGGSKGYMARWDGTGLGPNEIYDIEAPCVLSGCALGNVMHIIDAYGRLKRFDGTSFKEIARLPVANQLIEMPGIYNNATNVRWISHRSMYVVDGRININVNNFVSAGVYVEDMPSGVWELDDSDPANLFLYHKSAPCADTNDWGQQLLNTAGALYGTKRTNASYLAGFSYFSDSGATIRNGIFYDDVAHTTSRRSIFITPWLGSDQVTDAFEKIHYRFRQFVSGSSIIGRFRTDKSATLPFVASITWTSTTTFTSTDANFQYASVKDEVEVVQGKGASTTAHITAIAVNAGTYTVTIVGVIGFSSGSAKVKINNYRYMGTLSKLLTSTGNIDANAKDTSIQIKTEIRDEGGFELDDITINSSSDKLIK